MINALTAVIDLLMLRGDGKVYCALSWDEFNDTVKMCRKALAEKPRNCDRVRDIGSAVERFMKEDFAKEFPKKVVDWNWNHLNRFILWLFETE